MGLSQRPLIATSLAPRNLPRQKLAVASWLAQGFDVVSVNCAEEIAQLTPQFPEVGFHAATGDARELTGKPLVPLNDLLAALREENRAISGIVNSDIVLRPLGTSLLWSWLTQTLGDGLAFARRMDQETEFAPGVRYDVGIDVFFFGRPLLFAYPSTPYFVGLPWWDYFFAAFPILARYPTVEIGEPIAFHVSHPSFYDPQKHWIPLAIDTLKLLSPLLEGNARLVSVSGMEAALKAFQALTSPSPGTDREQALLHAFMGFAHATIQLIEIGAQPDRVVTPPRAAADPRADALAPAAFTGTGRPTVSVLLRACNGPQALRGALDCLVNQTYRDFEVVIVNDGDTGLESLLLPYASRMVITYLRRADGGIGAPDSALISASGSCVARLNDTDRFPSDHLAALVFAQKGRGPNT